APHHLRYPSLPIWSSCIWPTTLVNRWRVRFLSHPLVPGHRASYKWCLGAYRVIVDSCSVLLSDTPHSLVISSRAFYPVLSTCFRVLGRTKTTSISTVTITPNQSSPLGRTMSPFKAPRPPPCTPANTAKLWDEYERRAVENARRRETTCSTSTRQTRFSSDTVLGIIKSYDPHSSPRIPCPSPSAAASPPFDFGFSNPRKTNDTTSGATVATCKICKQPIPSSPGVCEACKKTIILPSLSGESTPPLTPACRNFASTDLPQLEKVSSSAVTTPTSSPPKRQYRRCSSTSAQLVDPPIRLSSLLPPPPPTRTPAARRESPRSSVEDAPRPRKTSLTDPNEPFLRLQIPRKPVTAPLPATHQPSTPSTPPPPPSSTPHSKPPPLALSLANTPPTTRPPTRHTSATPSELSTLYPYLASPTTSTASPPSLARTSYQLQHTTSAWDEWDSDEEEEKAGLVRYWRGRRWRGSRGSRGSLGGGSAKGAGGGAGGGTGTGSMNVGDGGEGGVGRKRRGFVRVLSCGCGGN
ncbi:hypothetical protein CC80DRAFT_573734, partial [Byssothecium circinans]